MYISIEFILSIIFLGISLLLAGLSYIVGNIFLNNINPSYEKVSSYECGFDAFSDSRNKFDIKFYLIAILFIIFDIEIIFFFPYIFVIKELFFFGYINILLFMIILLMGFFYEWKKGCMDYT